MAKEIVIQVPEGTPLGEMAPEEIEKLIEQATAHLPKAEHTRFAEQVLLQTATSTSESTPTTNPRDIEWRRICRK